MKFSESLQLKLRRARSECIGNISNGDGIKKVNDFFSELDDAVKVLEDKFSSTRSSFGNVQRLLPSQGMVARALRKMHLKIVRRLHTRPKLAHPWLGEYTMDMPREVFTCISKDIMERTNFGHQSNETNTQIIYQIVDLRKAKYLFKRMNLDGAELDRDCILKKPLDNGLEKCEVIVCEEKPMELKFHKNNEVLTVTFHYGYWNSSGIPQH